MANSKDDNLVNIYVELIERLKLELEPLELEIKKTNTPEDNTLYLAKSLAKSTEETMKGGGFGGGGTPDPVLSTRELLNKLLNQLRSRVSRALDRAKRPGRPGLA